MKKNYNPEEIEDKWYAVWEGSGYFKPASDTQAPSYCIVIPPPNVTGSLHMGHALNATIQDVLARWKRMSGYKVLWLPGTDHAGIATQNVVERDLSKEGIDRHKLGREAFIKKIWEWKGEYGGRIIHQLKKLGASCDWSRERFTLDEGLSKAVREVFVRLFEEEIIYRDNRLINWCPRCHTALSDLEVEHDELEGKLYYIRYPLKESGRFITVATTRPETLLGDMAVAVHPEDDRYMNFIGKEVELPLTGRKIPVIADPTVDPKFGTGAVKVTPAHDFNDEAMGKRHGLTSLGVIAEDARMGPDAGTKYAGLDRFECRKKVINDLKALDLLDGERKHLHSVGHCYRCKTIIEPFLTIQWYVRIESLATEAVQVVKKGDIRLVPDSWENNYFAWMKDIRDWCISRQIWWGHQIPVWYCPDCKGPDGKSQGEMIEHIFFGPLSVQEGAMIAGGTYSDLRKSGLEHDEILKNTKIFRVSRDVRPLCQRDDLKYCPSCGSSNIIRDPDVLDTWFSSALWPFSTLGWPENTEDLKTFYPTSTLVTGFDILFFWVARMIMMGMKFMGNVPFKDVYIHALVRDAKGHKMSKSKGNVIDPLVMIERFGADAFRFSLIAFAAQGRDVRFSEERVEGYRFFINKLWNATKFILNSRESWQQNAFDGSGKGLDLSGRWILGRLSRTAAETNDALEKYRFNDAANCIYQFAWHEFCDWYIEITKPVIYQEDSEEKRLVVNCLFYVLEKILLLIHPFMPFVTEEIWSTVFSQGPSIMTSTYPVGLPRFEDEERQMDFVINAVTGIRSVRGELNVQPSLEIRADIKTLSEEAEVVLKDNLTALMKLTRSREINIGKEIQKPGGSAISVTTGMEIYIPIEGLLDIKAEIGRLEKEAAKIETDRLFLNKKLLNEDFLKNAPGDIVEKEKSKLEETLRKKEKIEENIKLLMAAGGR